MQTFLPFPDFARSAACLDWRRLGKQRAECIGILNTIRWGSRWDNHPAVNMWRPYPQALASYGLAICNEWRRRKYHDTALDYFTDYLGVCPDWDPAFDPWWLGDERFHSSHRAALLAKDPEWYGKFGWSEEAKIRYWWPSKEVV